MNVMKLEVHLTALAIAGLLLLAVMPAAEAECTIDNPYLGGGGISFVVPPNALGQSFIACQTGFIVSVSILTLTSTVPGTATLGLHAEADLLSAVQEQSVGYTGGTNTFLLDPPFPVENGTTYAFFIAPAESTVVLRYTPDSYPGGTQLRRQDGTILYGTSSDLAFSIVYSDSSIAVHSVTWGRIKSLF